MQTNNMEQPRKRNNQQEQEEQREHLECPRCGSSATKFCYYNNYNKSQPRHFCKGCKRHWTKGGTLRTIPLGGTRKNKRQKLSNKNISVSSINHTTPINSSSGNNDYGINNNFKDDHEISFVASFQDQSNQFSCSEIGDFGSNLPLFVPKSKSLDEFGYAQMPDSSIESTITTTMHMDSSNFLSKTPWEDSFLSDSVNLSSLWDWNEINSLVSADLDVPWDDAEIKFQN